MPSTVVTVAPLAPQSGNRHYYRKNDYINLLHRKGFPVHDNLTGLIVTDLAPITVLQNRIWTFC